MSGLIAHLKRRNMRKNFEEESVLPQPQAQKAKKVEAATTPSSKVKPLFRYISEVTFNSD
jgi:hypothetical protein